MYDLIVIGAGPAGYEAALKASELNKSVLLVEKDRVGGTCLNYGCIPTKSLLHQTRKLSEISELKKIGITIDSYSYDYSKFLSNKDNTVNRLVKGIEFLLKKSNVDLIIGEATLESSTTIKVNDKIFEGENILIATGAKGNLLNIEGFEYCISSKEFLDKDLSNIKKVVIIGGGVIGVEIATILTHLKIETVIIEVLDDILKGVDEDAVSLLKKDLKRNKVKLFTNAIINKIEENKIFIGDNEIDCDFVIACVGRKPDLSSFDPNKLLIKNGPFIEVDKYFKTNFSNIYAVGDCVKGIQLAHYASSCAINIVDSLYSEESTFKLENIPRCIYCDKEISTVGEIAEDSDIVVKYDLVANPKAVIENNNRGFYKLIFTKEGFFKGATLACSKSSDMINLFVSALNRNLTIKEMINDVYPHPSYVEGIKDALSLIKK